MLSDRLVVRIHDPVFRDAMLFVKLVLELLVVFACRRRQDFDDQIRSALDLDRSDNAIIPENDGIVVLSSGERQTWTWDSIHIIHIRRTHLRRRDLKRLIVFLPDSEIEFETFYYAGRRYPGSKGATAEEISRFFIRMKLFTDRKKTLMTWLATADDPPRR